MILRPPWSSLSISRKGWMMIQLGSPSWLLRVSFTEKWNNRRFPRWKKIQHWRKKLSSWSKSSITARGASSHWPSWPWIRRCRLRKIRACLAMDLTSMILSSLWTSMHSLTRGRSAASTRLWTTPENHLHRISTSKFLTEAPDRQFLSPQTYRRRRWANMTTAYCKSSYNHTERDLQASSTTRCDAMTT